MRLSDVFSGSKHKEAPPAAAGPAADDLDALTDPLPEQNVPVASPPADPVPEPKPREASYRYYFRILGGGEKAKIEDYDFNRDGTLTVGKVPDGYELLDQYWIEEGRTLVYIALNKKTNQTEYLLFEPPLSDFEYELLERIHEDLLDVLILTGDEIRKERREILLNKALALLEDYGLRLDRIALFQARILPGPELFGLVAYRRPHERPAARRYFVRREQDPDLFVPPEIPEHPHQHLVRGRCPHLACDHARPAVRQAHLDRLPRCSMQRFRTARVSS